MKYRSENALDIFDLTHAVVRHISAGENDVEFELSGFVLLRGAEQNPTDCDLRIPTALMTVTAPQIDGYVIEEWDGNSAVGSWVRRSYVGDEAIRRIRRAVKRKAMVMTVVDFFRDEHFHVTVDLSGNDPLFTLDITFDSIVIEWEY